jgi:hypothetical protein
MFTIFSKPVMRRWFGALLAPGQPDSQRDAAAGRGHVGQADSPFVLVASTPDDRWGVFQRDFHTPQAAFDELQEACDYANELARIRIGAMVLIRKRRDSAAGEI